MTSTACERELLNGVERGFHGLTSGHLCRSGCIAEACGYVHVFEFKRNGTTAEALAQIDDKGYVTPYETDARTLHTITPLAVRSTPLRVCSRAGKSDRLYSSGLFAAVEQVPVAFCLLVVVELLARARLHAPGNEGKQQDAADHKCDDAWPSAKKPCKEVLNCFHVWRLSS